MHGPTFLPIIERGRWRVRPARNAADLGRARALRARAFFGSEAQGRAPRQDGDRFDAVCDHFIVEPRAGEAPVATFRLLPLASGAQISTSYSAQFYDLSALAALPFALVELGRFCVEPGLGDADVLRLSWAAMAAYADALGARMMFGCTSFAGTDPAPYAEAFALLRARHLAPEALRPRVRAPQVVRFGAGPPPTGRRQGLAAMPPLLRSYLGLGGWVSDHAVIDEAMGTLHVFTGLEISRVPPGRARALRALAGQGGHGGAGEGGGGAAH